MNLFRSTLLASALLAAFAAHLQAVGNPPELVSYQGYLVDANGVPLGTDVGGNPDPANYDVIFRIFNASSGGDLLWAEQQTITIDAGYFSVLLGEGAVVGSEPSPALSEVFTGIGADERFIGVAVRFEVGGEFTDILPRLRLLTSPYAFLATQARSVINPDGQPLITAEGDQVTIAGSLTTTQPLTVPSITGSGADLTNLNAGNLTAGTVPVARIPGLPASQITSGTLNDARLSSNIARLNTSATFSGDLRTMGRLRLNNANYSIGYEQLIIPILGTTITIRNMAFDAASGGYVWRVDGTQRMSLATNGNLSISGSLSQGSDVNTKEAIVPVDGGSVLERVRELPIYEWSYQGQPENRHLGPMAQDFHAAFGLGHNDTSLAPGDLAGVSVAAIRELSEIVSAQEAEIADLRASVDELRAAVLLLLEAQTDRP